MYGLKFAFNDTFKALVAGPGKVRFGAGDGAGRIKLMLLSTPQRKLNTSELLYVGTLAGLFQTVVTYPLETIRTRLSLGQGQGVAYKGIIDCVREMVRTEGMRSL